MKARTRHAAIGILLIAALLAAIGIAQVVVERQRAAEPLTSARFTITCTVESATAQDGTGRLTCTPDEEYGTARQVTINMHDRSQLRWMEHLERDDRITCDLQYRVPRADADYTTADDLRSPYLLLRDRPDWDRHLELAMTGDELPNVIKRG
ncbi:hypothetical protein [Bifidobacterium phasiani]|uniref:Secreted protein n=1 Tax=Bifidobacterium phasiani TaxID=2834431 RepID=A0ABS6WAS8_9BIFI|nr:hypothetical protein [Bifidobacterium phasiani]MBW3083620.1 hypothetical protein [Bifidobacterium phasiani]